MNKYVTKANNKKNPKVKTHFNKTNVLLLNEYKNLGGVIYALLYGNGYFLKTELTTRKKTSLKYPIIKRNVIKPVANKFLTNIFNYFF